MGKTGMGLILGIAICVLFCQSVILGGENPASKADAVYTTDLKVTPNPLSKQAKEDAAMKEKPLFSFGVIADIQYADKKAIGSRDYRSLGKLSEAVKFLNSQKPDFVVDLGDLSDGIKPEDLEKVMGVYAGLEPKLYHVVGNHDLVLKNEKQFAERVGLSKLNYTFNKNGYRFIVLNSLEVSKFSRNPQYNLMARETLARNPKLRPYDGKLSYGQIIWLCNELEDVRSKGEKAIICCHVPLYAKASAPNVTLWNQKEMLGVLSKYNDVTTAWMSGHYHGGGFAEKDGIAHLTVQAISNAKGISFAIIDVFSSRMVVNGYGGVPSRVIDYSAPAGITSRTGTIKGVVVDSASAPLSGVDVMTDNGRMVQTDKVGKFSFPVLSPGRYALKAVLPGKADAMATMVNVDAGKSTNVKISFADAKQGRGVIAGAVTDSASGELLAAYLEVKDSDGWLHWFDVAGVPYGGKTKDELPKKIWHQKNHRIWTEGKFALSAKSGKVRVGVRVPGYVPVNKTVEVKAGAKLELNVPMKKVFDLREEGWFRGDFHAHGVHGEKIYAVNLPFISFVARAEHYDWLYVSSSFNNDKRETDNAEVMNLETGKGLFFRMNSEYPKTKSGHVGNIGVAPPKRHMPHPRYSNMEVIRKDILGKGGVAVAAHTLYGHMFYRELALTMMACPQALQGVDFYTRWNRQTEDMYAMLLNKGYRLCRSATSDAALDLGRSPGTMGATFVKIENGEVNKENIVEAVRNGRTVVSWSDAMVDFTVDKRPCGEVFAGDGKTRHAKIKLFDLPRRKNIVTVVRNGVKYKVFEVVMPANGRQVFDFKIKESEKAWYSVLVAAAKRPESVVVATSPVYFGDWTMPKAVDAVVECTVLDAKTGDPISAKIEITDNGKSVGSGAAKNGVFKFSKPFYCRVRVTAPGYAFQEKGISEALPLWEYINSVTIESLGKWETYESIGKRLQNLKLEFRLKKKAAK